MYTPYGGLIEHHLRIGDTEFYVPPTAISVHRQMQHQRTKVLRARNSLPKESGYFNKIIELTIFFPDKVSINNELRPLLAQLKKCPFLPIENTYLNDIHKVDAVTISGVTVQTTPGFPHTLQAQIQCYAFEPASYIADSEDRTFDEMIDWPLFRWYYQRNLDPEQADTFNTYYEPLYGELENDFKFRIAAIDDLEAMSQWSKDKKALLKKYINDKKNNFWGNEQREKDFNEVYNGMYDKAMYEYDLHYEDWDIPGLVLTDFSVGFENTITSLQLQDDAMPTHQYMGSQDTIMVARFQTNNAEAVASLESLLHRSTYLIRNYHKQAANGFLEFDHQLARLFGVRNVTIEDVQTNTIDGQPGSYDVTLTLCAYNRAERKLNEVKWLSETADWNIDKYEDQGFWSIFTSPFSMDMGLGNNIGGKGTATEDFTPADLAYEAPLLSPIMRIGRLLWDRPAMEQLIGPLKVHMQGHKRTAAHLDEDDIKQIIYDEAIMQFFRAAEVYPDLELPTYGECAVAGFDVENTNNGIFVEPDFFIKYKKGTLFFEELLKAIQKDYKTVLRDGVGGQAEMQAEKVLNINDVTKKETKKSKEDYEKESGSPSSDNIPNNLIDKGNLKPSDMEALIREKAKAVGLNQNLPLAFARTIDEELKQFYEKGTNAKQGKVVNQRASNPIMLNSDLKYYMNADGEIDGEYIGVMKVRRQYGSNVNMLGKNIEYNIESGVKKMAQFYAELERIYAKSANGKKSVYHEENVYHLFNLKDTKGSFDKQKARFAGVIMMYLGFEKEYTALVKENKRPSARIVKLIKTILAEAKNEKEWTSTEIHKKVKDLPIKDFKTAGNQSSSVKKNMTTADFESDAKVHHGMMYDMLRYDKRGRLVRAFPTFFLTFIDEGQFIGTVKLSDQFFQYQAVMDIMYTNSRKEASSTLVLEMSNVYGTLDDAEKAMDLTNTSYGEVFKTMTLPGAVAQQAERSRHRNSNYYKSIMLRTGTRIHFRMGYGSNAMELPTIMNGTITSIQNNGESLTVIAQDDGIELTNKIRADVNETTDGGFLFSKKEPTEIVDELLTDSQGFFKNLWAGLSNEEFEKHSLGIMHFGSQGRPQGWIELSSYLGGWTESINQMQNQYGSSFSKIMNVAGSLAAGPMFNGIINGRENRELSEINMNVYQTTGLTNEEQDQWWNKVKDAFGIGKADEPGINIGLYDKSVWDVMNICASIGDDHIVAVHPFGFRNTVFSGKTYFPLHYDYIVKGEKVQGTAIKPFRQFHVYDSTTSILNNSIQTSEENIRTVAVGVYMNEGEMDTTAPVYVDTNIWPEKQRVVNIDTTMNAQGVRLIQNIPLVGGLLNKPFKWYFDEGVAIKITARGLSDYVRDMYDGYVTVMGDPSLKPYDQAWIYDHYNSITGPADVKEVTQIMNHEVGYITTFKPDAVVVNSDRRSMGFLMSCTNIAGSAAITFLLRKKLRNSKYAGHLPILNAAWASTTNNLARMKNKFATGKVTGRLYDTLTGKIPKKQNIQQIITNRTGTGAKPSDVARWAKNGMLDKLNKLTGGESKNNLADLLNLKKKIGFGILQNSKIKTKAAGLLVSGTRNIRKYAKGAGMLAKALWTGGHVLAGPLGWIAFAIEALVTQILATTVGEFLERWLFMRQAVLIAPLSKSGLEFTAGINGHKGSVMGDPPDFWQGLMTNEFVGFLAGAVLGVDTTQYSQGAREGEVTTQAVTTAKAKPIDMNAKAAALYHQFKCEPKSPSNVQKLYDADRKAALEQTNKRLELLGSRDTKAVYAPEEKTWEQWKDKIAGWFNNLWDKIKDLFGSSDNGEVCIPAGDVPTNGKAKGLSSHFKVIGPKIEAEAKKQGLGAFAEIIKAKCMQESGGNYQRYPDVMQASESMGKPIGYIKDVDQSIHQGVKYFGQIIKKCKGDIKMAIQSYNFGGGFIDYAMSHGGRYTVELAYQFAEHMVQKMGKRISRIPPGYGDCKYVEHVLRYYDGNLPSGACSNSPVDTNGANSCPSVIGSAGKKKYHTISGKELVQLGSGPWDITIVGGTDKVRPGTKETLANAIGIYGSKVNVTSGWRPGDPNWHGTGWAVDLDTPNTMRYINGKMRFPNGSDKNNARRLAESCIQAGFRALYFGDWDIVQEMNKKYGAGTMNYDPAGHYNHLHCSFPICKNKK